MTYCIVKMRKSTMLGLILRHSLVFICFFILQSKLVEAQNKHALLIGISNYPTYSDNEATWPIIHGENDIRLIMPLIKKQGFNVKTLTGKDASYKNIILQLKLLSSYVAPGDIIYIHFSGHGQAIEDEDGDEADGWDEAFIPYDAQRIYRKGVYAGEKHLTDDILNRYLTDIRHKAGAGGIVYVVVDACHAGSSYRGDDVEDSTFTRGTDVGFSKTGKTYAPKIDKRGNIRIQDKTTNMAPVYMLEACRSYEVNTEIKQDGKYYGPMTYYISRQLLTIPLGFDIKWIESVRKAMDTDMRLVRQHLVMETSK